MMRIFYSEQDQVYQFYFEATSSNKDVAFWLAKIYTRNVRHGPRRCWEEVKTVVGNWAGYAAQTNVAERLWKGIAKELMGVWWMLGFGWSDLIDRIWAKIAWNMHAGEALL